MYNPVSSYRIQFNKDFTFRDLGEKIPYFKKLGIKTIYASPIFKALAGSTHGYDIIDPNEINPEIGSLDELLEVSIRLKESGIGWIQDIVPNHMAFHPTNPWLADVLKFGKSSSYAKYFDIYSFPVMAPFLGDELSAAIEKGDIVITETGNGKSLKVYSEHWPLDQSSLSGIEEVAPASIEEVVSRQHYQLCHWRESDKRINFRRFFTVSGLIGLNIQDSEVFDDYHKLIIHLVQEKVFDGLRIDHIDGLYDPEGYLSRLRNTIGPDVYITVEKILAKGEDLPEQWPVEGTTGYDFLASVNNLFVPVLAEKLFTKFYDKIAGTKISTEDLINENKLLVLDDYMGGELDNLTSLFKATFPMVSAEAKQLRSSLAKFLTNFPVYRLYPGLSTLSPAEKLLVNKLKKVDPNDEVFNLLLDTLLDSKASNPAAWDFIRKCMQLTGPVMAKGVEDTMMYSYSRLLSLNEVGGAPEHFGSTKPEFHSQMIERLADWPNTMNTLSTHDTKRGEDARARLNAFAADAERALGVIGSWFRMNSGLFPDKTFEYFIYQSIIGSVPLSLDLDEQYFSRLKEYLLKASREAKTFTNWSRPNNDYERQIEKFTEQLFEKEEFVSSLKIYVSLIIPHGIANSLAQTVLKFTCPGFPDTYQGSESWEYSFVDPDNRRKIDYDTLESQLDKVMSEDYDPADDFKNVQASEIKLWLVKKLLKLRSDDQKVFQQGDYIPLKVEGPNHEKVCAYARVSGLTTYIIIVSLCGHRTDIWNDCLIMLPDNLPEKGINCLTLEELNVQKNVVTGSFLSKFPVAVLKFQDVKRDRASGVLMHISSLPSAYGIGDMGPAAFRFADFLQASGQKYWQVLPLNPVEKANGFSPYSSYSAFAGNYFFISPELLQTERLLSSDSSFTVPPSETVDFNHAEKVKKHLLLEAYESFKKNSSKRDDFESYCESEGHWLTDFACFVLLKDQFNEKPWRDWPSPFATRSEKEMARFKQINSDKLRFIKWTQFIFHSQWTQLKDYCNSRDIQIIGDLPLYVSHDSADVWSHPELFDLDSENGVAGIAGVPPDYFNADGQLWGMPVFKWDRLAEDDFEWWIKRISKNIEFFDLIRIDHFRAFAAYWRVKAGEANAVNGEWITGPGSVFFDKLLEAFPTMPFIAEDLGEIDDSVYQLRDRYSLPGMKVLQFAFGDDISRSIHAPHNHKSNDIVYTGTHDNNTVLGWFKGETDRLTRSRLKDYYGQRISNANVNSVLIRSALSSVAKISIIPMQDLLKLDEKSRINTPASIENNWSWRASLTNLRGLSKDLWRLTHLYGRI